jgi:hypothetical protein
MVDRSEEVYQEGLCTGKQRCGLGFEREKSDNVIRALDRDYVHNRHQSWYR